MIKPFETDQFFAGSIHAIDYMIRVASETQGSGVWLSLFEQMRMSMVENGAKKGFDVGHPDEQKVVAAYAKQVQQDAVRQVIDIALDAGYGDFAEKLREKYL